MDCLETKTEMEEIFLLFCVIISSARVLRIVKYRSIALPDSVHPGCMARGYSAKLCT
jgi:hypothetical protein